MRFAMRPCLLLWMSMACTGPAPRPSAQGIGAPCTATAECRAGLECMPVKSTVEPTPRSTCERPCRSSDPTECPKGYECIAASHGPGGGRLHCAPVEAP